MIIISSRTVSRISEMIRSSAKEFTESLSPIVSGAILKVVESSGGGVCWRKQAINVRLEG